MGMFVNPGNQAFQVAVNSEIYKSRVGKPTVLTVGRKPRNFLQLSDNDVEFCRNVVQATARCVLVSLCVV